MKRIVATLGTIAVALAIVYGAIVWLDDRETLTSPPDAIAEGFIKQIVSARYERALPYLQDTLADRTSEKELKLLRHELTRELGEGIDVHAEPDSIMLERASSNVTLKGSEDERTVRVSMVWRDGVWKIVDVG